MTWTSGFNRGAVGEPAVTSAARPIPGDLVRRRDTLDDVADTRRRDRAFHGRCYLCGQPINRGLFCYTHDWAGQERTL